MCFYVISSDLSLIFSENLLVILFVFSLHLILLPDHLRLAEIAISKHDKATRELSVLMNNAEKSGIKDKRIEHIRLAEELDSIQEKLDKGITFSMSLSIEFVINFSTFDFKNINCYAKEELYSGFEFANGIWNTKDKTICFKTSRNQYGSR